jgi:hypothetical protein
MAIARTSTTRIRHRIHRNWFQTQFPEAMWIDWGQEILCRQCEDIDGHCHEILKWYRDKTSIKWVVTLGHQLLIDEENYGCYDTIANWRNVINKGNYDQIPWIVCHIYVHQSTASKVKPATPTPIIAPKTVWVVDTGQSILHAKVSKWSHRLSHMA